MLSLEVFIEPQDLIAQGWAPGVQAGLSPRSRSGDNNVSLLCVA